jgi:hypothetical protein
MTATGTPLVDTGGRFMTGAEMAAAGEALGVPAPALYLRGRVAALGEVGAAVAESVLAIFPTVAVHGTWRRTSALPAPAAAAAYGRACHDWGRRYLEPLGPDVAGPAERVVDTADVSALPLTAAWRARPRPDDAPARAAHALMLLRELRGGLHFCALRAEGLTVPLAALVDPLGGAERLRRTGWPDDAVAALVATAGAVGDAEARWHRAEAATDVLLDRCLDVLEPAERDRLAGGIVTAEELSRESAPAHQRARLGGKKDE